LGLATRSRAAGHLRADAGNTRDPNHRGKVMIDITGDPAGPPKIAGGGPLCSWGSPQAGSVTFRMAPLVLTYPDRKRQLLTKFHLFHQMQMPTKGSRKGRRKFGNRDFLCYVLILHIIDYLLVDTL
jgi:hypothetical protein